jgi:hypothetical protein
MMANIYTNGQTARAVVAAGMAFLKHRMKSLAGIAKRHRLKPPSPIAALYIAYCVACLAGGGWGFNVLDVRTTWAKGDQEKGGSVVTANNGRWSHGTWISYGRGGDPKGSVGNCGCNSDAWGGTGEKP